MFLSIGEGKSPDEKMPINSVIKVIPVLSDLAGG